MLGAQQQLAASVMTLNCVAELRRAKETAEFFDSMPPIEQQEWVNELLTRLQPAPDADDVPRVCLLDSGVNIGHPLLAPLTSVRRVRPVFPAWGTNDSANHGTGLAALASYGDLSGALAANGLLHVAHRFESVKLTPAQGANQGDAKQHGYLFAEAVSRPEISAPTRPRVFTSAVTASDARDRGRPSAWSATIDRLASDYDGAGQFPRLFVLCAGNIEEGGEWAMYPASLSTSGIRDPGQAWNALTVGAFTEKVHITEADAQHFAAIAPCGGLSPYTRTSSSWDGAWPLKPDVVLEGGNAGTDAIGATGVFKLALAYGEQHTSAAPVYDFKCDKRSLGPVRAHGRAIDGCLPSLSPRDYPSAAHAFRRMD